MSNCRTVDKHCDIESSTETINTINQDNQTKTNTVNGQKNTNKISGTISKWKQTRETKMDYDDERKAIRIIGSISKYLTNMYGL